LKKYHHNYKIIFLYNKYILTIIKKGRIYLQYWKRIGPPMKSLPHNIDPLNDECFYMREYYPRKGFLFCETNQLIKNFKHDIKSRPDLENHKILSINKFAEELSYFFDDSTVYHISFIPPSKCKSDRRYDDRLEKTLNQLVKLRHRIVIEEPISIKKTIRASHFGGPRLIDEIADNYNWKGLGNNHVGRLYVIDDIITTGSHYKAFQKIMSSNHHQTEMTGLFWAFASGPA